MCHKSTLRKLFRCLGASLLVPALLLGACSSADTASSNTSSANTASAGVSSVASADTSTETEASSTDEGMNETNDDSNVANDDSNVANTDADVANTDADVANGDADVANTDTDVANTDADVANTDADVANTDADVANGELTSTENGTTIGLKDVYADYFEVGVCINPTVIKNSRYAKLVTDNFSSATCENDMKPDSLLDKDRCLADLPNDDKLYADMSVCENELAFAAENGMKMRGHTFIWYQQTPDWIFYENYDVNGELADRATMLSRVESYMSEVFGWVDENYPGLFYAWDIVNEAMGDDYRIRENRWYQTIGPDYLEQVFAIARKYAPEGVLLFYNDYNEYNGSKQNAIIEMLKPVAEAGNLDGIGMQAHLNISEDVNHFVRAAQKYVDELGVVIHVTEIDVSMPSGDTGEKIQGMYYASLFRVLAEAKANGLPVESVSVWGLTDSLSWKAEEKPLLFHGDLSPKLAYEKMMEFTPGQ